MTGRPLPPCEYHELAVGHAVDSLEPSDEHTLRRHLPACTTCEQTVHDVQDLMAKVSTDGADIEAPPSLWQAIRAELPDDAMSSPLPQQSRSGHSPESAAAGMSLRQRLGEGRPWVILATAAALVAVLGLGAWNVVLSQQQDRSSAVSATRATALNLLERPDSRSVPMLAADGSVRGTMVMADGKAWLIADHLPANDTADSTFVLWGLTNGHPSPLTTFDITQTGLDVVPLGSLQSRLGDATAFAISHEPGRTAPSVPSNQLATGFLS